MTKPAHRDTLRAFATGDIDTAERLSESIPDSEREDFDDLASAFFAVLLQYQFDSTLNRDKIERFVQELGHDHRDSTEPVNMLAIEATIRATFGDERMLDELSPEDILVAQFQVIGKIVTQNATVSTGIDGYLDTAEKIVASWETV